MLFSLRLAIILQALLKQLAGVVTWFIVFLGLHIAIKFKHPSKTHGRRCMSFGMWCCINRRVFSGVWRVIVSLSSGSSSHKKCILGLLDLEEESTVILWKVGNYWIRNTASHSRRPESSSVALWGPQVLHKTGGVLILYASRSWKQKFWGKPLSLHVILMLYGFLGYNFR
jgi:hypothetical protein